ncbi:hypothetical protein V1281_000243 [Nitrobacteraceae bacterium AZCC 2161]
MSGWSERRGAADDLCYLRQAHLFQTQGVDGRNTDIAHETDGYSNAWGQNRHPEWNVAGFANCHPKVAATGKIVLQYPPGVGFLLAPFPEGHQVATLYAAACSGVPWRPLATIGLDPARPSSAPPAFRGLALYFMISHAKASYSIASTTVICAAVGFLTAKLFRPGDQQSQLLVTAFIGLLLGLSVRFRIPNPAASVGYGVYFLVAFAVARNATTFLQGALFGAACLVGLVPTLIANAINAGGPFATTYGPGDVMPPDLTFSIIGTYLGHPDRGGNRLGGRRAARARDAGAVVGRPHHCHQPRSQSRLLPQPPRHHAILPCAAGNAVAVVLAIRVRAG